MSCSLGPIELTKHPVEGFSAGLVDDNNIFEVRESRSTGKPFDERSFLSTHSLLTLRVLL